VNSNIWTFTRVILITDKKKSFPLKIVYSILLVSLITTTIGSFLLFYFEKEFSDKIYSEKVSGIKKRLPSLISNHVYVQDDENIKNIASSFYHSSLLSYLEIKDDKNRPYLKLGKIDSKKRIEKEIKIFYQDPSDKKSKKKFLGEILLQLKAPNNKDFLKNNIFIFFLIQLLQLLTISYLIYNLLNKKIALPLNNLFKALSKRKVEDFIIDKSHEENNSFNQNIEINKVMVAFNNMKEKFKSEFSKLKEINKSLEEKFQKISDEDSSKGVILDSQNKEIKKFAFHQFKQRQVMENMLNNLEQGYLTFDHEGIIDEGATKITEELLEATLAKSKREKTKIWDILYKFDKDNRHSFKKWVEKVFEGKLSFKDLKNLAPKNFTGTKSKKIILEFKPIYRRNSEKDVESIICIATDKTSEMALEKEAELEKQRAQRVLIILEHPVEFKDLISDMKESLKFYIDNLRSSNPDDIYRRFHTLKALFSSFKIMDVAEQIHELEDYLDLTKRSWESSNIASTWNLIDKIKNTFNKFVEENRKLIEVTNNQLNASSEEKGISNLMQKIESFYKDYHNNFVLKEVSTLFNQFVFPTEEIARTQDKEIKIDIKKSDIYLDSGPYKNCISSFIHIFRNIVDHGIESIEERKQKGKEENGILNISFVLMEDKDKFKIIIEDDGQGIDHKRIIDIASKNEKFRHLKFDEMSKQEAVNLIFEDSISSKNNVDLISGRGVGMKALKKEIEKLGGSIKVSSEIGRSTTFEVILPLIV